MWHVGCSSPVRGQTQAPYIGNAASQPLDRKGSPILISHTIPVLVVIVQSPSPVLLFVTPWTAARQASLSFTISQSLLKLMSIELVMPSNHLILCHPLLLLPSIFPSIRFFSSGLTLCIRWPSIGVSVSVLPIYIQG